ncbi:zinc finger CCHC domain-containing protein 24-like [Corticium candelabrum]|uniref:zinc finger CCHC domain-containing protein 24-like n=1 Tax=Corticium candelabrum TaxID=121492 RepID=UPI002E277529|nr:zinc finger CCHC domain-containing protein 24-like [Corticium candelabrum]
MSWTKRNDKSGKKTPDRRYFGEYKCSQCSRTWKSANSFVNFGQMCKSCNTMIYAHNMKPLKRPEDSDDGTPEKSHPKHLCELCRKGYKKCFAKEGQNLRAGYLEFNIESEFC